MITAKQVLAVFPKCRDSNIVAKIVSEIAPQFEINNKHRLAMWFAQCGHESASFNNVRENLSYSVQGLMKTWPKRFPTEQHAVPYARQPERLANFVYADRLGNGDAKSNDGWKFRGGGWIQLTGRDNYRRASQALQLGLEQYPQRIENAPVAARVAAWFWKENGLNELADAGDFDGAVKLFVGNLAALNSVADGSDFYEVCKRVNGGEVGIQERLALWIKARAVLA